MNLVICGGGISGLSSAYYATKLLPKVYGNDFKITILEREKQVGGWMLSNKQGNLFIIKIKIFLFKILEIKSII